MPSHYARASRLFGRAGLLRVPGYEPGVPLIGVYSPTSICGGAWLDGAHVWGACQGASINCDSGN